MIRRHRIATVITILGISFTPPIGFAEVLLYETGFEAPGFIAGKYLAGQSGWVAFQNANANAATVTTERSRTGTQSAKLDGAVMGPYLGRDYFDAFLFHGIGFDPIGSGNPIVEFSVDVFYIPNGGGSDARAQIEIYDSAGSFIGEVSVDTAGEVFASGSNPLLPAGTALCSIGEWNKLGATINFLDHKVGFQLNGTPFGTTTVDPQVVDIYDADLSLVVNFKRSDHVVYYDNYRITAHAAASPPVFTGMEYRPDHSVVLSLQGGTGERVPTAHLDGSGCLVAVDDGDEQHGRVALHERHRRRIAKELLQSPPTAVSTVVHQTRVKAVDPYQPLSRYQAAKR